LGNNRIGLLDNFADSEYQFEHPYDVCFNPFHEEIIVADVGNKCLKIYTQSGQYLKKISNIGEPHQILSVLSERKFYLLDKTNKKVRSLNINYTLLDTMSPSEPSLDYWKKPVALGYMPEKRYFIVDQSRHAIFVYRNSWDYHFTIGIPDESGNSFLNLFKPSGIACYPEHHVIFIADTGNKRILCFSENGRFISAYSYIENAYDKRYSFQNPSTLGVLSQPGGHDYFFIQEQNEIWIALLNFQKNLVTIQYIRDIKDIKDAGGFQAIPNSDVFLIANTKRHTIEILHSPYEIMPNLSIDIKNTWNQMQKEFEDIKDSANEALLHLGIRLMSISDLITNLENLRQKLELSNDYHTKLIKFRENIISESNNDLQKIMRSI